MQTSIEELTTAITAMTASAAKAKAPNANTATAKKRGPPKPKAASDEGVPLHSKASSFRRHPKKASLVRRLTSEYIHILYIHILYMYTYIYIYIYTKSIYTICHIQASSQKDRLQRKKSMRRNDPCLDAQQDP